MEIESSNVPRNPPNLISELALFMWLLPKGVNVEKWKKRALESA
jgi:hypothetical protein